MAPMADGPLPPIPALILASQSASRRAMLDAAGVRYTAIPAHIDEGAIKDAGQAQGHGAGQLAAQLAEQKALTIARLHPGALVIGSDSIVSTGLLAATRLFDKPRDRADAAAHLRAFSGQDMWLSSAVAVAMGDHILWRHVDQVRLAVRSLSEDFIATYLDAEWPAIAGCVGCFRIEGPGVQLFSALHGDYFTILGMPLLPLLGFLRQQGVLPT